MLRLNFIISIILNLSICFSAFSSHESDSLHDNSNHEIKPFISLDIQQILAENRSVVERGFSAGITIKEKINLGVFSSWTSDYLTFEKLGIPSLRMQYRQGGVLTSYDHHFTKKLILNIGAKVGQGRTRLLNVGDKNHITTQRVVVMHPGIGIETSIFNCTKVKLNVGYRLMTDQKMQHIIKGNLTGFSYGVSFKVRLL